MTKVPFTTRVAVGAFVTLVADAQRRREEMRRRLEADMERRVDEFLARVEEAQRRYEAAMMAPVSAAGDLAKRMVQVQQAITQLAIRGDEALAPLLTPPVEQPAWATFDEDEPDDDEPDDDEPDDDDENDIDDETGSRKRSA